MRPWSKQRTLTASVHRIRHLTATSNWEVIHTNRVKCNWTENLQVAFAMSGRLQEIKNLYNTGQGPSRRKVVSSQRRQSEILINLPFPLWTTLPKISQSATLMQISDQGVAKTFSPALWRAKESESSGCVSLWMGTRDSKASH